MKRIILIIGLVICLSLLLGMSLFRGGQSYLRSFEGKVLDAETKEPIEGAAVLAVYYQETISPAGSNHYAVDAQETLTDANGEFKIPASVVKLKDVSWKPDCNLTIFKPGYGVFPDHKLSNAVGEEFRGWPTPEKYIVYEIPKLKSIEERKKNLLFQYYEGFGDKKFYNFLNLINEEYKNLGLPGISLPEKEK
jgi:hypothetical protein